MKKIASFIFLISLGVATLHADDQISSVQQELKDQGFYYGQVDGQPGAETTAAIRRYQIRNGLQVSGTLTQETINSLKAAAVARDAGSPVATDNNPTPPPQPAQPGTQQQQTPAPPQDISQSDRDFLRKQNGATATAPGPAPAPAPANSANIVPAPAMVPQPQQPPSLAIQFASLYERTPYEKAPLEVQQGTLRNAQIRLARETYYNGEIDGIPGPATARAIAAFQSNAGIAQSGRLDLDTLNALHLLPNAGPPPGRRVIIRPFFPPPIYVQPRIYRGND